MPNEFRNARFNTEENDNIIVELDGDEVNVPVNPGNRHYAEIVEQGIVIAPYVAQPPESVVSFDNFEARFTAQEWDGTTDFVYEVDITTGKPKRKALVQGLARAQARNHVDLLDARTDVFMDTLVSGGVITAPRKTAILTP